MLQASGPSANSLISSARRSANSAAVRWFIAIETSPIMSSASATSTLRGPAVLSRIASARW